MPVYRDLMNYIYMLPAAFAALVLHEWVKAKCSAGLGDPTPKYNKLLRGNPFSYIEPIGYICAVIFGFGWGRPTPTSPLYYKDRKKGILITYITPSIVNMLTGVIAAVLAGLLNIVYANTYTGMHAALVFAFNGAIRIVSLYANCSIAISLFNLIPVPPLDSAKVLQAFLSPGASLKFTQNEKLLQLVLILVIVTGIAGFVINPITSAIISVVWSF